MEIRPVNAHDDPLAISVIYEQSWRYAYRGIIPQTYLDSIPHGRWAAHVTKGGMHSLVLLAHGQIIGTASVCRSRWAQYPGYGEIVSIYLLPDAMGKGYGAPLLRACLEALHEMGHDQILLWVLEENARARRFYEKNGFVCADVYLEDTIGGRAVREVMYRYDVRP